MSTVLHSSKFLTHLCTEILHVTELKKSCCIKLHVGVTALSNTLSAGISDPIGFCGCACLRSSICVYLCLCENVCNQSLMCVRLPSGSMLNPCIAALPVGFQQARPFFFLHSVLICKPTVSFHCGLFSKMKGFFIKKNRIVRQIHFSLRYPSREKW